MPGIKLPLLQELTDVVVQGDESSWHLGLRRKLKANKLAMDFFVDELARALEKPVNPIHFSGEDDLITLLNRLKNVALRDADILKKIPEAKKHLLKSALDLDAYPTLKKVLE